jgi:threonine synthase
MPDSSLVCSACARRLPADPAHWRCPCGGVLDLEGAVGVEPLDLGLVTTPLLRLAHPSLDLFVKVEGQLPTGSFKDRGSAILVAVLAAHGVGTAVADSSGNAGASLAAHCAAAGIGLDLYAPATASPGKLVQARAHGARVHLIEGPRQAATDAARKAVEAGAAYATHAWSPFFLAGTASFGRELETQLGRPPDALVIPVGAGTLALGAMAGLRGRSRLYGVQSAACAPLATAFAAGLDVPAEITPEPSLAEGVLVASPPRGGQVLHEVRESGGEIIAIADDALGPALARIARAGVLPEPTAALTIAAADRLLASGALAAGETVVCALTGHGLKAPAAVARALGLEL